MKRPSRRKFLRVAAAALFALLAVAGGVYAYVNRPGYGLPFRAAFNPAGGGQWSAYGGVWDIGGDGTMRNGSNDRGAKILAGSTRWRDYTVEAELQLLGTGSVGVLARVSDAEVGENSFLGYFAGIRTVDNSLVIGSFDFAYHEAVRITLPDRVRPFRWYRVKLHVEGCQVTASASAEGMPEIRTIPVNEPDCFRSGSIGLRSNGTGGVWRNVVVTSGGSAASQPEPAGGQPATAVPFAGVPRARPPAPAPSEVPVLSAAALLYRDSYDKAPVAVRGAVVLTKPVIFVQDVTGGVEIQPADGAEGAAVPVKIGDEVEVTGQADNTQFTPVLRQAQIRLLREATPGPPAVLTAHQLAEGFYDGRFVQVEGILRSLAAAADGSVTIDMDAGSQSFHALLPPGRSAAYLRRIEAESRLRLKGVPVVDARFNEAGDPFVLLVRAAEDVELVAGRTWWRPSTFILAALIVLGLVSGLNYLYLLAKHWRLRAVADERERLAHEIHDTLAQSFAGIGFQLQAIRNSLPRGDADALQNQVDLAISMTRTSHVEARRSIASLRPESLGAANLLPSLREFAERMVKNGLISVETSGGDGGRKLPQRMKDTLYRIGQEAIANAVRHASPRTIRIQLERSRLSVRLAVEDDGIGFVVDSGHEGFGLLGMRNRAESIPASLVVKSTPGTGTRVEVTAPIRSLWPFPLTASKDI